MSSSSTETLAGSVARGHEAREDALKWILLHLDRLYPGRADETLLIGAIERTFGISFRTAFGYLMDLVRRGLVRRWYGAVELTSDGLGKAADLISQHAAVQGTIA